MARKEYDTTVFSMFGIDPKQDFHELTWAQVEGLVRAAKDQGYKRPVNANGSAARYFYALLQRQVNRSK